MDSSVACILFDSFESYGRPGVELSARHQEETVIQELHFLPEQVSDRQALVCKYVLNLCLQSTEEIWGCVCLGGAIDLNYETKILVSTLVKR